VLNLIELNLLQCQIISSDYLVEDQTRINFLLKELNRYFLKTGGDIFQFLIREGIFMETADTGNVPHLQLEKTRILEVIASANFFKPFLGKCNQEAMPFSQHTINNLLFVKFSLKTFAYKNSSNTKFHPKPGFSTYI
jgi:hypothetical protein